MRLWRHLAPALGAAIASCGAPPAPREPGPSPTITRTPGDWDDVDASVGFGAGAIEATVVNSRTPDDSTIVYELLCITDDTGTITARRAGEGTVELEARIGRAGDPAREIRALRAMSRRLGQLHGVEWAPVR